MTSNEERLITLRFVNIFSETPEEILAIVADFLEEVEVKAGETLFHKGDRGTSMYIIADGRVRVHDGDRVLNDLGKREVFGEMAALDPEPRSASITALEDTQLLRLDQNALYDLMSTQTGVTRGIIHILCQRLRARVKDMSEDFKYMQQFARVTSAAAAVEAGLYEPELLDEVAERGDELGQLARVFQRMVKEVYSREQRLKKQVEELRIEIDEVKKEQQVAEIVETDYFRELREKAHQLRQVNKDTE